MTDGAVTGARARSGLEPTAIDAWRRRIGAHRPMAEQPTRYLHRRGVQGLGNYLPTFDVRAQPAATFEEYLYWRPLSELLVFSLLRTPCITDRTSELVREYRSRYVLVGTQWLPGGGTVRQSGRTFRYSHPRHLVMVHNDEPFTQVSDTTADLAGMWVPVELLGGNGGWPSGPLVDDSPLARATAAFVTSFANDVAARRAVIDADGEVAVAELVRAALAVHREDSFSAADSALYVREVAERLVDQNYRDPDFDTDTVAGMLFISRRQLYRAFDGEPATPAVLIVRRRLERARELLARNPRLTLDEIAAASGFRSTSTLAKRFRAEYGFTTGDYRAQLRAGQPRTTPADSGSSR